MILITGASSAIGKEAARLLAVAGKTVRCMTHRAEILSMTSSIAGTTWVLADFDRPDTLSAALRGVDSCLLLSAAGERQVEQECNFIEQARQAGVRHLVKISALAASSDALFAAGRAHAEIERRVERSGIPFTHVQSHFFMQNVLRYANQIRATGKFVGAMGNGRISMVDASDVAAVCSALLQTGPRPERRIAVTGPQAFSFGELAGLMSKQLRYRIDYVEMPVPTLRQHLILAGRPEWLVDNILGLQTTFRTGLWEHTTRAVEDIAGRPATSFESFLKRHLDTFYIQ